MAEPAEPSDVDWGAIEGLSQPTFPVEPDDVDWGAIEAAEMPAVEPDDVDWSAIEEVVTPPVSPAAEMPAVGDDDVDWGAIEAAEEEAPALDLQEAATGGSVDQLLSAIETAELSPEYLDVAAPHFIMALRRGGYIEHERATGKYRVTDTGREASEDFLRVVAADSEKEAFLAAKEKLRRVLGSGKADASRKKDEALGFLQQYYPNIARRALEENPEFEPGMRASAAAWVAGPHEGLDQFTNFLFSMPGVGAISRAFKVDGRNIGAAIDVAHGIIEINPRVWKEWLRDSDWQKADNNFESGERKVKAGDFYRLNDAGAVVEQYGPENEKYVRGHLIKDLMSNEEGNTAGIKNSELLRQLGFVGYRDMWPDERRNAANRGWVETAIRSTPIGQQLATDDPNFAQVAAEKITAAIELPLRGIQAGVGQVSANVAEFGMDIDDVLLALAGFDDRRPEPEDAVKTTPGGEAAWRAARELGLVWGEDSPEGIQEFALGDVVASVVTDVALDAGGILKGLGLRAARKLPAIVRGFSPGPLTRRGAAQFDEMQKVRLREALSKAGVVDAADITPSNLADKLTTGEIRSADRAALKDWLSEHTGARAQGASIKNISYEVAPDGRVLGVTTELIDDTAAPLIGVGDNTAIIPWSRDMRTVPGGAAALNSKMKQSWSDRVIAPLVEARSPLANRAQKHLMGLFGLESPALLEGALAYERLTGAVTAPFKYVSEGANLLFGTRKKLGRSERAAYEALDEAMKRRGWTQDQVRSMGNALLDDAEASLDTLLKENPEIDKATATRFIRDAIEANMDVLLDPKQKWAAAQLESFVGAFRAFEDEVLAGRFGLAFQDEGVRELVVELEAMLWREEFRAAGKGASRDKLFDRLFSLEYGTAKLSRLEEMRIVEDDMVEHLRRADDLKLRASRLELSIAERVPEPTSGKARKKSKVVKRARLRKKLRGEIEQDVKRLRANEAAHRKRVSESVAELDGIDKLVRAEAKASAEQLTARKLAELAVDEGVTVAPQSRRMVEIAEDLAQPVPGKPLTPPVDRLQKAERELERLEGLAAATAASERAVFARLADASAQHSSVRTMVSGLRARVRSLSDKSRTATLRRIEADLGEVLGVDKVVVGSLDELDGLVARAQARADDLDKIRIALKEERRALLKEQSKTAAKLSTQRVLRGGLRHRTALPRRKQPKPAVRPSAVVARTKLQQDIAAAQKLLDEKLGGEGTLDLMRTLGDVAGATPHQIIRRALEHSAEAFAFDSALARALPEYDKGLTKAVHVMDNMTDRDVFIVSDAVKTQGRGGRYQGLPEGFEFLQPVINRYRQFFQNMLETLQSNGILDDFDLYDFLDRMDVGSYVFHTLSRPGTAQARLGARAAARFATGQSQLSEAAPFLLNRKLPGTGSEIDALMQWNVAEDIARWQAESGAGAAGEYGYTAQMARERVPPPEELIRKIMKEMPDELLFLETDIGSIANRYLNHASRAIGNKVFMDDVRNIVDVYYPEARAFAAQADIPGQIRAVDAAAREFGMENYGVPLTRVTGAEHAAFLLGAKFPTGDRSLLDAMDVLARNGLSPQEIREQMLTRHGLHLTLEEASMVKNGHVYLSEDLTWFIKAQAGDSQLAQGFRQLGQKFPEAGQAAQTTLEFWDNITGYFKGLATVGRTWFHGRNQIGGIAQNLFAHGQEAIWPTTQMEALLIGLGKDLDSQLTLGSHTMSVRDWTMLSESLRVVPTEMSAADLVDVVSEELLARSGKGLSKESRKYLAENLKSTLSGEGTAVWDDLIGYTFEKLKDPKKGLVDVADWLKQEILSTPGVVADELEEAFKAIRADVAAVKAGHIRGPAGRLLSNSLVSGTLGVAAGATGGGAAAAAAFGAGAVLTTWATHLPAEKLVKLGSEVARAGENHLRLSNWVAGIKRGMSPVEAAHWVNKALFDYSPHGMSYFEYKVMRRLVPFYVFRSRNLKYQAWLMLHRPQEMKNMFRILNASAHYGSTPEERSGMPDWMQNKFIIGMGSGTLYTGLGLPVEDTLDLLRPIHSGALAGVPGSAGAISSLNPYITWFGEEIFGKSFFFDKDIPDIRGGADYASLPYKFFQEIVGISPDDPAHKIGTLEPTKWWIPDRDEAAKRAYILKRIDLNLLLQQWYRMFAESYQEATGELAPSDVRVTVPQRLLTLGTGVKARHVELAADTANRKFLGWLMREYQYADPSAFTRGGRMLKHGGLGAPDAVLSEKINRELELFTQEQEQLAE